MTGYRVFRWRTTNYYDMLLMPGGTVWRWYRDNSLSPAQNVTDISLIQREVAAGRLQEVFDRQFAAVDPEMKVPEGL